MAKDTCKDCGMPIQWDIARAYLVHTNRCRACEMSYRQTLAAKEDKLPFPKLRAKLVVEAEREARKERNAWITTPSTAPFGFVCTIRIRERWIAGTDHAVAMVCVESSEGRVTQELYPLSEFWVRSFAGTARGDNHA